MGSIRCWQIVTIAREVIGAEIMQPFFYGIMQRSLYHWLLGSKWRFKWAATHKYSMLLLLSSECSEVCTGHRTKVSLLGCSGFDSGFHQHLHCLLLAGSMLACGVCTYVYG